MLFRRSQVSDTSPPRIGNPFARAEEFHVVPVGVSTASAAAASVACAA
jgi:hypothetical protein